MDFRSQYDEAPHAAAIARHLGTDHTELYVTPNEARDVIPSLHTIYDEPFADSSQIPTYLVAQLARSQVTVALSGDGGDELFGGYTRYAFGKRLWGKFSLSPSIRRSIASALRLSRPNDGTGRKAFARARTAALSGQSPGDKVHKLADVLAHETFDSLYRDLVSHWNPPLDIVLSDSKPRTALDTIGVHNR